MSTEAETVVQATEWKVERDNLVVRVAIQGSGRYFVEWPDVIAKAGPPTCIRSEFAFPSHVHACEIAKSILDILVSFKAQRIAHRQQLDGLLTANGEIL